MKDDTRHKVEISVDSEYSQEFADWLNEKGHIAFVGRTTENFINGVCIADGILESDIMRDLWEEFHENVSTAI